ncbi:MAG: GlsB/YeaQ/YmgE family stress response membrane protein [Leptospirales bacterium]|nr:GlsB/YeaQ/YmgE family stress response membrane protein [Leptospirales bacterium]
MDFGIFGWIFIGLIAGVLGRFLVPGDDKMGIIWTILLGIGGALLGGFVFPRLGLPISGLWSYVAATAGAVVLVLAFRFIRRR